MASEANVYSDIDAVLSHLVDTGVVSNPAQDIILYGQSGEKHYCL